MIDEEAALSPLHEAIEALDYERVRRLLRSRGIDLEAERDGLTPLMIAVSDPERELEMIGLLVRAGADVAARDPDGDTPLHYSVDLAFGDAGCEEQPLLVARMLVDAGADVEAAGAYGWTPLMKAALQGTDEEFAALLELGAKFDVLFPPDTEPLFLRDSELAPEVFDAPVKLRALLAQGFVVRPDHVETCRAQLADARLEARRTLTEEELEAEDELDAEIDAELEVWLGPEQEDPLPRDRNLEHRAFWREQVGRIATCLELLEIPLTERTE